MSVGGPAQRRPQVTTTDVLKLVGLVLVLTDHWGLFFDPGEDWWRVIGRGAAPVFFFLIGFARTRTVPRSWLVLGCILTALDVYVSDDLDDVSLNILFNFAILRLVAPWVERSVLSFVWGAPVLALACVAATPVAGVVLEYGASGWLWALLGLTVRTTLPHDAGRKTARNLVAIIALSSYVFTESLDFAFAPAQSTALLLLMSALTIRFLHFRRKPSDWIFPQWLAPGVSWAGRRSLEIYAVTLFAMQALGHALGVDADMDGDMDE